MPKMHKVVVLLETSHEYGRGLMRGIVRYARLNGPWSLHVPPWSIHENPPRMDEIQASGVIARITSPQVARVLKNWKLPAIVLEATHARFAPAQQRLGFCEIHADSAAVAKTAAKHLMERGFRQFAYCGLPNCVWSYLRQQVFSRYVREAGFPCSVYPCHADPQKTIPLAEWLQSLPRPVGLMACNDERARQVLLACENALVQVPEELAVVGVDNDELLCELSTPSLSSVALNLEEAGYQAAELLDGLMRKRIHGRHEVPVHPTWVHGRRSTDVVPLTDRETALALRFIRDHANQPVGVNEVADATGLSRRTLERRFRQHLGRSVLEELTRCRLERAKRLLLETDLSMEKTAHAAGFGNLRPMLRAFRQGLGCSPTAYRHSQE